jgi:radical SAM protein with 4Fe4S-binding SPASM domain
MSPDYYRRIIDFLDERDMRTTISLTTNLWDFYKTPEKWIDIFKNPRVGIATSFNYGNTRRITASRVFTEDIFWKVSNMFLDKIGYRPDFISVITEENEDTALDNVKLAKEMGVECKLNYAMASGDQSKPYLLSKIYKLYLEVIDAGLLDWEFNAKQMVGRLNGSNTVCPQNRDCDSNIRCMQPDGDYYSCGAFGDDQEYPIDFEKEMNSKDIASPLSDDYEIASLKAECYSCPMFSICNGCKKTIKDLKVHKMVEEHCSLMKTLADKIVELNENVH